MTIITKNKLRSKTKKLYKQIPLKDINYPDLFQEINKSYPINFKKYNFLNKVHEKHPLLQKEDIALVVKAIFETIRENVIEGYSINVKNLFNEFRLSLIKKKDFKNLKINNRTVPSIRRRK